MRRLAKKGFTLIELLVVIGLLAVIAAGIIALMDPRDKVNQANDSKVATDVAQLATASQAYASQSVISSYPSDRNQLKSTGQLTTIPMQPDGTDYSFIPSPSGCDGVNTACTALVIYGTLKSKKYTGGIPSYSIWRWDSSIGKSCPWSGPDCMPGY